MLRFEYGANDLASELRFTASVFESFSASQEPSSQTAFWECALPKNGRRHCRRLVEFAATSLIIVDTMSLSSGRFEVDRTFEQDESERLRFMEASLSQLLPQPRPAHADEGGVATQDCRGLHRAEAVELEADELLVKFI